MIGLTTSETCPRCGRDCYIKNDKIFCFKCQLYLPTFVCDCCQAAFVSAAAVREVNGLQCEEAEFKKVCNVCWTEVVCHDGG